MFIDDVYAKRVLSLANHALGVMTGASLAVSLIRQALAAARESPGTSASKQADRLSDTAGVVPWDLVGPWVREAMGARREIVVAMDWTDFDADNQATLALHLVTRHGRATPLLWLSVDKDELKNQRNAFAIPQLTLLGTASESLGMDHHPRTSTVRCRAHSLLRQGCPLHDLIPNMPEERSRPLIEKYQERPSQNKTFSQAFGIV